MKGAFEWGVPKFYDQTTWQRSVSVFSFLQIVFTLTLKSSHLFRKF